MSKLTDDDKAFCVSRGLTYIPPKYISLEEFEAAGPYYQNQGPMQGEPQMWTPNANRRTDDDEPAAADTTTSRSEWIWIGAVALILAAVAVMLAQAGF